MLDIRYVFIALHNGGIFVCKVLRGPIGDNRLPYLSCSSHMDNKTFSSTCPFLSTSLFRSTGAYYCHVGVLAFWI